MRQILSLVLLLTLSMVAKAQAPSNYTNINGRYRWIAGMFDSTFHIPKGTTASLRTGGSTNAGGLFYNTSDSSVYTYTGTQWIKVRGSLNPSDTTNKYITQVYKKNGSDSVFYVKGGIHTWAFNDSTGSAGGGGGGKVYYLNGGVSMGTFGGFTMYELGDTANTGAAANFTRATTGNIANFITDPNKPGLLQIPSGVWTIDAWLSETGGGANHAEIYAAVEKWNGSAISTIATSPIEQITEGNSPNLYTWSVSIPTTAIAVTDRIIIQFYIQNTNGKTVTLYTQNGYVGEVHTTFTTGIGALNGLTAPAQYLSTGTSGTDFNISSVTATHTFNLPTASATNRGALSTTDWTTFNSKVGGSGTTNYISKFTASGTIGNSNIFDNGTNVGIGTANPTGSGLEVFNDSFGGRLRLTRDAGTTRGALQFGRNNAGSFQETSRINATSDNAAATNGSMTFQTSDGSGTMQINMTLESDGDVSISNKLGIGTLTGDSAITVVNGARFQRGVRMSGLPTAVGTKALRIDASGTLSIADTLTNGISGSGTANYLSKFNGTNSINNSGIIQYNPYQYGIGASTNPYFGNGYSYLILNNDTTASLIDFRVRDTLRLQISGTTDYGSVFSGENTKLRLYGHQAIELGVLNLTPKMYINNIGRVGIATISPTEKLQVNGRVKIDSIDNATTDTDRFLVSDGGVVKYRTGSEVLSDIGGAASTSISGTTNYIPKFTSSSAIGNSQIFDNGTNVGIGTITPAGKLSVAATNGIFNIANGNTNGGVKIQAWNAAGNADGYLAIEGYTIEYGRFDASGNLGLGVTPSAMTNVRGIELAQGSQIASRLASGVPQLYISSNIAGDSYAPTYSVNGYATQYRTQGYDGSHSWWIAPSGTAGNAISFTQAMTLDASGNLGVGVTNPAYKLDVNGTIASNDGTLGIFSSGTLSRLVLQTNGTNRFDATSTVTKIADQSGTEVIYVKSSNVGIGTTNPNEKLNVYGLSSTRPTFLIGELTTRTSLYSTYNIQNTPSVEINTNTTSGFAGLTMSNSDNTSGNTLGGISFVAAGTSASEKRGAFIISNLQSSAASNVTANIEFYTNNSGSIAERMRITSGGYVGINEQTPNSYLHVKGSLRLPITSKTATYTLTVDDYTVIFDAAAAAANLTANLPDATTCTGRIYTIYCKNTSSYGTTVDGNGSQTINGYTTYSLNTCDRQSITIQSDGSNWIILAETYQGCY